MSKPVNEPRSEAQDAVNVQEDIPFFQQAASLPAPLLKRFMKQIAGSLLMAVMTIVVMLFTKDWEYCWGFLFSLYIAYLGVSLVWKYREGKILCQSMACIKATRLTKQRMFLILREMNPSPGATKTTHEFYIPASGKDLNLLTQNTIMDVYYDPSSPIEIIAWEITGNL